MAMLFHKENCYKIEWVASQDEFLAVIIEHYAVCSFDTESYVFFEAVGMLHRASILFGDFEEEKAPNSCWSVIMAEKETGFRKAVSGLLRSNLGIEDIFQLEIMTEDSLACLFANSTA